MTVPPDPPSEVAAGRRPATGSPDDTWRTLNLVMTIVSGSLLALGLVGLAVLAGYMFLSSTICGMYCGAAFTLVDRMTTALGVGSVLALLTVIPAAVWRRWSSVFLGIGVVLVILTALIMMAIMSTPLSEV